MGNAGKIRGVRFFADAQKDSVCKGFEFSRILIEIKEEK